MIDPRSILADFDRITAMAAHWDEAAEAMAEQWGSLEPIARAK